MELLAAAPQNNTPDSTALTVISVSQHVVQQGQVQQEAA